MSSAELAALVELLSEAEWAAAARCCLALGEGAALAVQVEPAAPAQGDAGEGGGDAEGDPQVAGFVGETLPVRVTVRQGHGHGDGDGGEAQVLHMFLKVVPRENAARARLALSSRAFVKEAGLYGRAFPLMEAALARGRGRGRRWRPRCFVAREDLLLMEDLRHLGFRPLGNRQVLEEAHCATALEALAALHAASLALEAAEGAPPLGERFREHVQENMFTDAFPSYMNHFITSAMPGVKHLVGLVPAYRQSPRYQEILRKIDQLPRKAYAMVRASGRFRNVVCHGDLWVGNVLFKYDARGSAEEARLVDFQQARYCPPALDVMSFLHLSTRRAFRAERGASLRSLYHRALVRELPAAERLLPREALEASCAGYAAFARVIAACYLPADLLPRAVLQRLVCTEDDYERYLTQDRSAHYERQWRSDAAYREAVQEVVEELVDGLLLNPDAWDAWPAADQTDGAC